MYIYAQELFQGHFRIHIITFSHFLDQPPIQPSNKHRGAASIVQWLRKGIGMSKALDGTRWNYVLLL